MNDLKEDIQYKVAELLEDKGYKGIDVSLAISLFEYNLVWTKNEHCRQGEELHFIAQIPTSEGIRYSQGYFEPSDLDWIEDGLFDFVGMTKQEWENLPFGQRVHDVINYYGTLELFSLYGSMNLQELKDSLQ